MTTTISIYNFRRCYHNLKTESSISYTQEDGKGSIRRFESSTDSSMKYRLKRNGGLQSGVEAYAELQISRPDVDKF